MAPSGTQYFSRTLTENVSDLATIYPLGIRGLAYYRDWEEAYAGIKHRTGTVHQSSLR